MNEQFEYNNEEEAEIAQILTIQTSMAAVAKHQAAMAKQREQESLEECDECGEEIPEARRIAIPGVQRCIHCQEIFERRQRGM
jgi:phage/conjugal plasmid C-4 type zinc finger TraR family protein